MMSVPSNLKPGCMTLGALRALTSNLKDEVLVNIDGSSVQGAYVVTDFDVQGYGLRCVVNLLSAPMAEV